ncbi:MAG: metallopeptidase family protein [Chloroflexi bacterium]|nr:metallopeptidase family protein [Chloroflexota bacterium]
MNDSSRRAPRAHVSSHEGGQPTSAASRLRAARGVRIRYRTDRRVFVRLVQAALAELPERFRDRLSNVAVVVEEWPSEDGDSGDDEEAGDLVGLYQGVPYGDRSVDYHLAVPDRITIYRGPILASARSEAEAREEIRLTVLHEIGHYFGLSDDELP